MVDALTRYRQLQEQIADGNAEENVETKLAEAKQSLVARARSVLGPRLDIDHTVLTQLQGGETSIAECVGGGTVQFDYDVDDAQGDEAADLFSLVTELDDTDPELALKIAEAIARTKIESVLAAAAPRTAREPKIQKQEHEPDPSEVERVLSHALSVRANTTELTAYLAGSDVSEGAAANAIMELAVTDRPKATAVLGALPSARVEAMTIGRLSMDQTGVLMLLSPNDAAKLVRAQLCNDQKPQQGFTDKNNMTVATLLMTLVDEHDDPNGVLAAVGENTVETILNLKYGTKVRTGDHCAGAEDQQRLQEYWHDSKEAVRARGKQLRQEAAARRVNAQTSETPQAPKPKAPIVDLNKPVDLELL